MFLPVSPFPVPTNDDLFMSNDGCDQQVHKADFNYWRQLWLHWKPTTFYVFGRNYPVRFLAIILTLNFPGKLTELLTTLQNVEYNTIGRLRIPQILRVPIRWSKKSMPSCTTNKLYSFTIIVMSLYGCCDGMVCSIRTESSSKKITRYGDEHRNLHVNVVDQYSVSNRPWITSRCVLLFYKAQYNLTKDFSVQLTIRRTVLANIWPAPSGKLFEYNTYAQTSPNNLIDYFLSVWRPAIAPLPQHRKYLIAALQYVKTKIS